MHKAEAMAKAHGVRPSEWYEKAKQSRAQVEAFLDAINKKYGTEITISEYDKHTLTGSTKSEAVTYLQIKHGNARYTGIAKDRDIVTSSLKAILKAVSSTRKDSSNESSSADIAKYQAVLR